VEYVGLGLLTLLVLGASYLLTRILRRAQAGDASKRGQDSAEPGGFYTDTYSGGLD
jgi:hypothetical protein